MGIPRNPSTIPSIACLLQQQQEENLFLKHENADVEKRLYSRILRTTIPQKWTKSPITVTKVKCRIRHIAKYKHTYITATKARLIGKPLTRIVENAQTSQAKHASTGRRNTCEPKLSNGVMRAHRKVLRNLSRWHRQSKHKPRATRCTQH